MVLKSINSSSHLPKLYETKYLVEINWNTLNMAAASDPLCFLPYFADTELLEVFLENGSAWHPLPDSTTPRRWPPPDGDHTLTVRLKCCMLPRWFKCAAKFRNYCPQLNLYLRLITSESLGEWRQQDVSIFKYPRWSRYAARLRISVLENQEGIQRNCNRKNFSALVIAHRK